MRDLFAILAIILAVVSLGIFRVPNENALLEAGIRAEAQAALYQTTHPITVEVSGRTVTARGRVESAEDQQAVLATLTALDGVEEVVDALVLMPQVAPFSLTIDYAGGEVSYAGHLPSEALGAALGQRLGVVPDLPLGAGAPVGFRDMALRAADMLTTMLEGRVVLSDNTLVLSGRVHLPEESRQITAALTPPDAENSDTLEAVPANAADPWPEALTDWSVTLAVTSVDDGQPYSLLATRDRYMGLELRGKLPPDFDKARFDALGAAQAQSLRHAPMALNQPGFDAAVAAAIPVFAMMENGALTIAPGVVSLTGGPVAPQITEAAMALRQSLPEGYGLQLALVPDDPGPALHVIVEWDGQVGQLSGRVPRDFASDAVAQALQAEVTGQPAYAVWPDLTDWDAPLWPGLAALRRLESGMLRLDDSGLHLTGVAADPGARALARRALGGSEVAQIELRDDGRPPAFALSYDAAAGGSVIGKLPHDLSVEALAQGLGVPSLRGTPKTSPEGSGTSALELMDRLRPWLFLLETVSLQADPQAVSAHATVTQGVPLALLEQQMGALPDGLTLTQAAPVPTGSRRIHQTLEQAQVYVSGHWLPDLGEIPTPEGCRVMAEGLPQVRFAKGRFAIDPQAVWALAQIAALGRACTRFTDQTLDLLVEASGGALPELDGQIARRRAEGLREALIDRGVSPSQITATGRAGPTDQLTYSWR